MKGCRPLTDHEYQALKNALKPRDRCILVLGVRSGFRISEILSLNVSDVFDGTNARQTIQLHRCNTKGKTEGRTVPMHPEAKECIQVLVPMLRDKSESAPLFQTKTMRRLDRTDFHKVLKNNCSRLRIPMELVATHSLRKTFALKMYKSLGENIAKLQIAMGHKEIGNTIKYINIDSEEVWDAIKNSK